MVHTGVAVEACVAAVIMTVVALSAPSANDTHKVVATTKTTNNNQTIK